MRPTEPRNFLIFMLFIMTPSLVIAAQDAKGIKQGACTKSGVHVVFHDGSQKDFSSPQGYVCTDFKISPDHRYAGWKIAGKLIANEDGQNHAYPDATVYVLIKNESYAATQNSRYINDWYFVPGHSEIMAETAFEHGPSDYVLYDLELKKVTETCNQLELVRCPRLRKLIEEKK